MVDLVAEGSSYRRRHYAGGSLDDDLWVQAISSARYIEERWGFRARGEDEDILRRMIDRGIFDQSDMDVPWDGAVRSMRHSSVMADRLLVLIEKERTRVGALV